MPSGIVDQTITIVIKIVLLLVVVVLCTNLLSLHNTCINCSYICKVIISI